MITNKEKESYIKTYKKAVYLLRGFIVTAIAFSIVAGLILYLENDNFQKDYYDSYYKQQKPYFSLTKQEVSKRLEQGEAEAVDYMKENYSFGSKSFWILASESRLLFYQDIQMTQIKQGITLEEQLEQYSRNGGSNIAAFRKMLNMGNGGRLAFSMDRESGGYQVQILPFSVGETQYVLLYCIQEEHLLVNYGMNKYRILMLIFVLVSIAIVLGLTIVIHLLDKKKTIGLIEKDKELRRKNSLILQLNNKLYPYDEQQSYGEAIEEETGVYTAEFLTVLLGSLNADGVKDIGIALLDCRFKEDREHQLLLELIDKIRQTLGENVIISRDEEVTLCLILKSQQQKQWKNLERILRNREDGIHIAAVFANEETEHVYQLLESVREELNRRS